MKTHNFKLYLVVVLYLSLFAGGVFAQNIFDITYPVPELGNCESQSACKIYCDDQAHKKACYQFAVSKGLIKEAKKSHGDEAKKGPGGCNSKEACRAYCELEANFETCMQYAEENDLMTKDEIKRAKKFMKVSSQGGPGGCKGRQCEQYCNNIEHRDECFEFAKKNNLLDAAELGRIEKGRALEAKVKESGGPGGCKDEKSCIEYCHDPEHVEECLGFATANGGMDAEEAERMLKEFTEHGDAFGPGRMGKPNMPRREYQDRLEKFEDFQKMEKESRGRAGYKEKIPMDESPRGMKGPGGCASPDECMKYCLEHREECNRSSRDAKDGFRPPEGFAPPAGNQYPTRPPEMMPPTTGGFDQQHQQPYRQEFQKQYEPQFQERYQQQQPSGSFREPVPAQQIPNEQMRAEPPAALNRTVEAFANVIFAPVILFEYLMAR